MLVLTTPLTVFCNSVQSSVLTVRQQLEICESVVSFVPIDVMDHLIVSGLMASVLEPDESVFQHVAIPVGQWVLWQRDRDVSLMCDDSTALPKTILRPPGLAGPHMMPATICRRVRHLRLQRQTASAGAGDRHAGARVTPIVAVNVAHRLSDHMVTAIRLRSDGGRLPTSTHAESRRIRQVRRGNVLPRRRHEWVHDTAKTVITQGGNR